MILYIPISVHEDGVHCGECLCCRYRGEGLRVCAAFGDSRGSQPLKYDRKADDIERCPQCLAQAKEIAPDDELTALRAQVEGTRRALHEIAEEWAGSECGVPVYAQEAYAIGLAKRMYQLAVEGLKGQS